MLRLVGAAVVGLVVGSVANMALIFANLAIYPAPPGTDFQDTAQMAAFIGTLPPAAFVLPFLAHLSQAGLGGLVAGKLSGGTPQIPVGVVVGLTLLGSVINLLQIPGPAWMWLELPVQALIGVALVRALDQPFDAVRS
jgi:hypothetical protein